MEFRLLKAEEIECRIASVSKDKKGVSVLLYKDARVDQNILDETVGSMNWQRHHSRDNANCIVSIWDEEKKQWIEKEDTGKESNTEKEKGLASDSFKRACFNWGIGRELYSAPFIWITDCEITNDLKCYDKFYVKQIGYDASKNINALVICNVKTHKVVYQMGAKQEEKISKKLTDEQFDEICDLFDETSMPAMLKYFGVKEVSELTEVQATTAIKQRKKTLEGKKNE